MISKEAFIKLLDKVVKPHEEFINKFQTSLGIQICEGHLIHISEVILDSLTEDLELEDNKVTEGLIFDWCYNLDFGKKDEVLITIDGVDKYAKTADQLYDIIMELK